MAGSFVSNIPGVSGEITAGSLFESVFSRMGNTEIKHYSTRGAAYFAEFDQARSIDPLPYILTAADSQFFATAAGQWGCLLDRAYRDIRGDQALLETRPGMPAALWRDTAFDPALNGLLHAQRSPLSMIGLQVVRDQLDGWQLVSLVSGPPRGLGFALETRIIHGRVFSDVLNRSKVLRLAPFFRNLKQQWFSDALHHLEEPSVMIWTPGPVDPAYAEHVYLCRYLGYPLVESRDLTVRSGKVFLKMLGGLRPVDVLVRLVADSDIDPLTGNPSPMDGVAGLAQAVREGEVFITNLPGSDVLEQPALMPYLTGLAAGTLESPLVLPWRADFGTPGTELFWGEAGWEAKPCLLSLFAVRASNGWELMPGGMARPLLAGPGGLALIEDGPCKDVWSLSTSTVPFLSLLPQRERPSSISRSADLPSRVADDLFWLGRYTERAWVDLRFLGKWLDIADGEGDELRLKQTGILADCITGMEIGNPETALTDSGSDWRLWNTLADIEHIASRVRDRFSLETHRVIRSLSALTPTRHRRNPPLRETIELASLYLGAFQGFTNEHMTRGSGWRFLDIGKRLERASLLTEAVSAFCSQEPESDDLSLLLELFDSMITYRSRYYFAPELGPLLDLLMLDESNPRSLAFQVLQLQSHLEQLPRNQEAAYRNAVERSVLKLMTAIRLVEGPELAMVNNRRKRPVLSSFLQGTLVDLAAISEAVHRSYLVKLEALQRMQAQNLADHP